MTKKNRKTCVVCGKVIYEGEGERVSGLLVHKSGCKAQVKKNPQKWKRKRYGN